MLHLEAPRARRNFTSCLFRVAHLPSEARANFAFSSCDISYKSGKKKQHKHKRFGPDFQRTFLALMLGLPRGQKVPLHHWGPQENALFGADVHDFLARTSMTRRVFELCTEKVCADLLAPDKEMSRLLPTFLSFYFVGPSKIR